MSRQYNPYEPAKIAASYSESYDGKPLALGITQEQIERIPAWPETEPQPPLPVRQAVALAQGRLHGLVREPDRWRLSEVTLKPFGSHGRWFYLVRFKGFHPPNVIDGMVPTLRIAVLMNGEVIEPQATGRP